MVVLGMGMGMGVGVGVGAFGEVEEGGWEREVVEGCLVIEREFEGVAY